MEKKEKNLSVKKGDTVVVITGKQKGKKGKIMVVDTQSGRVSIEGVNTVIKHKKPRGAKDKGGREKIAGTIDASNVMPLCPKCNKVTRVKHTVDAKGKSYRVCKCGESLDKKFVKAKKGAKDDKVEVKENKEDKKVEKQVKHERESAVAAKSQTTKTVAQKTQHKGG